MYYLWRQSPDYYIIKQEEGNMAIILIIKTEDGEVTELPLLSKMTFGRSSSSDYTIKDSKMSATHCSFEITPKDQVMFTDLGSSNGSYCNNSKVTQIIFKINDLIRIGTTSIKIEEKRLNMSERKSIGLSTYTPSGNDKTLLSVAKFKIDQVAGQVEAETETKNVAAEDDLNATKKRSRIVNKVIKARPAETFSNISNEIDQEASTGATKLLKLNNDSTEKKKKA